MHVVAIKPAAADVTQLQGIATKSGGRYVNVTSAEEIARNQLRRADTVSPLDRLRQRREQRVRFGQPDRRDREPRRGVGSRRVLAAEHRRRRASPAGSALPQRSNMMLTAGFALPGFDACCWAFRVYRPGARQHQADRMEVRQGRHPAVAGPRRTSALAGKARVPADPNARNIYTFIPDGSGGGTMVAFTTANETTLRSHMNIRGRLTA